MSGPLRIKFPRAIYHVTSRGDRRELTFVDDGDRHASLAAVAQAMDRFNAAALAYCQMGNHCHFVLHTHRAKLSRLLHHLLEWRVRAVICTALRASRTQRLALQRKQVLAAPQGRTLTLARIRTEVLN